MDREKLTPDQKTLLGEIKEAAHLRSAAERALKARNYRTLNLMAKKGGILFTGSSLMEQFPISEMCVSAGISAPVYNRGIGGTTTDDFLREIDAVLLDLAPSKVFINIGTNDMTDRVYGAGWMDHLISNYVKILASVREHLPGTSVYCMAFYPANLHLPDDGDPGRREMLRMRTPENIKECSRRVRDPAEKTGYLFIDVNAGLYDDRGELKAGYTTDGVHMTAEAYRVIFGNLRPWIG